VSCRLKNTDGQGLLKDITEYFDWFLNLGEVHSRTAKAANF